MKQTHDDDEEEADLQKPFDFSRARPNPYVRFAARAKGHFREVTDEEDARRTAAPLRPKRVAKKG
ncbi:MAG: hypothetical protein WD402_03290 [Chloroflexota bacterium]